MYYLSFEQVIDLHDSILLTEQPRGFEETLVRSIMAAIEGGAFNQLFHPTVIETGSAYLFYFARGQAFRKGNKRIAVVTCGTFLNGNDVELTRAIDPEFVRRIGAGELTKERVGLS